MLGLMNASDGNSYAVGTYVETYDQGAGVNFIQPAHGDTIFQIAANGSTTPVVSFTHQVPGRNGYPAETYSDQISPLVEGPDDALYGLAAAGGSASDNLGYFYKFSLTNYSVTILHTFTPSESCGT